MHPMRSVCNEVEEVAAVEDKAVEKTRWKRLCGLTIDHYSTVIIVHVLL